MSGTNNGGRSLAGPRIEKLNLSKWLCLQVALSAIYLPWAFVVMKQVSAVKGNYWLPRPGFQYLVLTFVVIAGSTKLLKILLPIILISILNVNINPDNILHGNLAQSISNFHFRKWLSSWNRIYLLTLWLLVPILAPFAVSQYYMPVYHYRYTIVASGAFYLLAAKGMRSIGFKYIKYPVVLLVVIMYVLSLKGYYNTVRKEQWREVIADIEKNARPGDVVLVHQYHCLTNIVNYYSKRRDIAIKPIPEKDEVVDSRNISELEPAIRGHKNIWLIMSHKDDPDDLLLAGLNRTLAFIYQKQYYGIELYLFARRE